ncbi:MAG TPA: pyridoxamine 5'-phosphate oxidase family protein [Solirubrobacteraceae bacterium]|nr:pyridoxamine 5'-phosphate oxidase family protein [Solirubrobacteraceae bacterium]
MFEHGDHVGGHEECAGGHEERAGGHGDDRYAKRRDTTLVELSRHECIRLLGSRQFGRVAVAIGTGAPIIRPVNYVFDDRSQSVVFRTAPGSKLHALLHAAEAAFEVDEIDPERRTGWSVVVHGVVAAVDSVNEIARLDRLGLQPWAPGRRRHWMRIRARVVSGRRIVVAQDGIPGYYLG